MRMLEVGLLVNGRSLKSEREEQTGVVGETPDIQPGNPYNLREVTTDRSLRGSNPGPPALVTGPLGHSAPTVNH